MRWYEVVGGGTQGGILVRSGESLSSDAESERLCTGAIVGEVEVIGERVRYRKISGAGPSEGWVSRSIEGSPLLYETSPVHEGVKMLTHSQCIEAQKMLKELLSQQHVQKIIAENHQQFRSDYKKYRRSLAPVLMTDVYPSVVKHFYRAALDVPIGASRVFQSLAFHCMGDAAEVDLGIVKTWLEIESLLRNEDAVGQAKAILKNAEKQPAEFATQPKAILQKCLPEVAKKAPTAPASRNGCEVFNSKGEVLGVEFRGRVRGGCHTSGCRIFEADQGHSRACRRCSKTSFDHEDLGAVMADSDDVIFRIKVLKVPTGSLDFLNVELPGDANVQQLRQTLGNDIPAHAAFFKNLRQLDSPLPGEVMVSADIVVSEVLTPISGDTALVKRQAQEAQEMLISTLGTHAVQQVLKEMDKDCSGKAAQYRRKLQEYLVSNVYPDIVDHFGLPASDGARHVTFAISKHSGNDINMAETWLMLEKMMRNEALVSRAESLVELLLGSTGDSKEMPAGFTLQAGNVA